MVGESRKLKPAENHKPLKVVPSLSAVHQERSEGFLEYLYATGLKDTSQTDGFLGAQIYKEPDLTVQHCEVIEHSFVEWVSGVTN